ncbi:hypothetical protein BC938DRAFT_474405 [Jimgerdemannia flammicorona]|uniref:RZ-type domain-containing protein n=1 Tax=Jimgerdemannia flammicorona TaxID=994334 RepID=A0A433QSJ8_9FUNG|nr:hypothetical protein BC938DRAFT_474405 [Jimgerdemannia flammicorona]
MNHNQNNRGRGNFRGGGAGRGGRGRGQNTNQTPGGPARQARPSGITPEQKRQIVERRQESIQISSDGTDDLIVAENGSEDIQQLAFVTLGRNSRAFEHQHRMRRFVNSCLVNLSNHHDVDTSGLLIGLVSGPGVARMNDIMLQPMSVDAGLRKWPVSFQYVVLPFVGVLTREKVCQTNMVQQANTIYTAVYVHAEQFLLKGVLRCMQELMDRQSLRDYNVSPEQMRAEDAGACTVTTFPHALLAITRLVFQLLTRVRDAKFEDHFTSIVDQLLHLATRCPQMPPDTAGRAFERDILNREIERINAIILDAKGLTLPAAPDSIIKRKPPGTTANIEFLERNFDPPGDFSPDGPRHDNDQPNIADIQVIPTQAEVTCKRTPFLPANGVPDAPHFIEPGWKRQLDIHFRLFREDMLDPLRKGILAFLRLLEQMTGETRMALSQQGRLRHMVDENVDLNVYCDVHFHGLRLTKQQRVSVEISFAQPKSSTARTADQRKEFWERSKNRLMQGGLICLVWKDTRGRTETATVAPLRMIFGIIIDRDVRQLAVNQDHAIITIALTDPSVYLLMLEAAEQGGGQDVEHFMVESPGVFFESYRPILKALQQCTPVTLPFGRYLAPTAADVVGPNNREDFVEPPLYTRAPGFAFDLSVILEPGQAYNLVTTDKASRALAVTMLQQHSTLDDTQARALVETLCREVALIKGPPGTGKTKIGIDLMRVFLHNANKMQCGPILCICYTNHALDQFLEHLLDQNVKSIVRVGAQSKSERLQDHNLEQLMRSQARSFDTRQAIYEGRTKWDQVSKNLLDIDKSLQTGTLPWKYLGPYLMDYWYDHYRNINNENAFEAEFEDEDDGGGAFQTVGAKNEDGPYHRWISGSDIKRRQEYLEYLRKQKKKARKERKANINRYAELGLDADLNGNYSSMRQQSPEDIAAQAIHIPKTNRPLVLLEVDGNVWNMSLEERRRLSDSWKRPVQENMLDELKRLLEESEKIEQNIKNAYDEMRRVILKKSTVIGMTTNGAAKYQTLVSSVAPRIIVCEEAGEVLESHILATLSSSTQHLILIGDHQQLRPHVATYNLSADSHVGRNYNLDKSLFERLVTAPVNTLPMSILTTQRRMRPEIANLIRNTLYPDLVDGGSALTHPPVGGMKKNLYFMDHNHPEDSKDQFGMQSYSNTFEVRMIEALVKYLIRNGYNKHGDIAVLTPYLGQLAKLRKVLMNSFVLVIDERDQEQLENMDLLTAENEEAERVEQNVVKGMVQKTPLQKQVTLRTIDNYQGEEAKIIIISLVRNLRTQDGAGKGIGFLKSPNRTNVLLSRAQHGMFLLGNANLLARNEAGIWPKIIDQLRETDCVGPGFPILCQKHPDTQNIIDTPEMFRLMAPHGGCNLPCSYNMDCGHVCPCQCHSDDERHVMVTCPQPCPRLHRICNHACPKRCGDDCGSCKEIVGDIFLQCSHIFRQPECWQARNPSQIACKERVERVMLGCEHSTTMACSDDIKNVRCKKQCGVVLPCGHPCKRQCHECQVETNARSKAQANAKDVVIKVPRTSHGACRQVCDKALFCGHSCANACHPNKDCQPCQKECVTRCVHFTCQRPCSDTCPACCETCPWQCSHQGRCLLPCGAPCNRLPCNKRCDKLLGCGHRCPLVCGEVCPLEKFCVVCADDATKDMIVDVVMQQTLREVNVDEDPLLILSCGHALTMSSLDGIMEMNQFYVVSNPMAETPEFTACQEVPGEEVKQQACFLCRKPIVELRRYGRRIKYAQLSVRSKKYIKAQQGKIKVVRTDLRGVQAELEKSAPQFHVWISKNMSTRPIGQPGASTDRSADPVSEPNVSTRLLRSLPANKLVLPVEYFQQIMKIYSIPKEQADRWTKHVKTVLNCYRTLTGIYESAYGSPAKQLFDASVAHLYRSKIWGAMDEFGDQAESSSSWSDAATATSIIHECIRECGIPPGGMDGSSSVESLQEIVNVQLLLHQQAIGVLEVAGLSSGWYWFVDDLIEAIMLHVEKLMVSAEQGKYFRHLANARLTLMDALYKRVQWLGRKPVTDETRPERLVVLDGLSVRFIQERKILRNECPLGIRDQCMARLEELKRKMEDAIRRAQSGTFYSEVTQQERVELYRAMAVEVGGTGHWYRCRNGHPYVIGECGMAMESTRCPECGAPVGGGRHMLHVDNSHDDQFERSMANRR